MKWRREIGVWGLGFFVPLVTVGVTAPMGPTDAHAHAFRPAVLSMREADGGEIDVLWKEAPELLEQAQLNPVFPPRCKMQSNAPDAQTGSRFIHLQCGPQGLAGQRIRVDGIDQAKVDVVWQYSAGGQTSSGLLRGDTPEVTLPGGVSQRAVSGTDSMVSFIHLGILHILGGVDHLLFIVTLLLLIVEWRALVTTVTAFTAAHSITLAAGVLGWVHAPQAFFEALILLSIVVVAAEAARKEDGGRGLRQPWRIAFVFGLVHGFGFAGALGELGIPQSAVPLALAGFNIGVEIGQLIFVATALGLLAIARKLGATARHRTALAYGIGSVATAWMLERVAQF